ncbi:uncharacterized protein STAUR_3784 [Stigmatella aurantiaca DW4/3-1]|uniref:Uncharacterized protein n=1 Tax=Stigmatella aurantiaca (strain DW4/3-1) TaxID=378806 RepID=E3FHW6_STIAD|nr:uncharacterized protein STAUR_3784 [Stigmatella aurantiaca DW4/3-1]
MTRSPSRFRKAARPPLRKPAQVLPSPASRALTPPVRTSAPACVWTWTRAAPTPRPSSSWGVATWTSVDPKPSEGGRRHLEGGRSMRPRRSVLGSAERRTRVPSGSEMSRDILQGLATTAR